ncbi:DASH complex subunit ask1 [Cryptotrichosporon argae]
MVQPPDSSSNPLLSPPFFLIKGIDPAWPVSAQMEKIDQANTQLLREIDANFARFHAIVTSKILPEFKRFCIAGEPTREAAQFWRSFFEAAAAVRVPLPADLSTLQPEQTFRETVDYTSASSFAFDPPVSSTPLAARTPGPAPDASWDESMESPFDRMDRRLREDLSLERGEDGTSDMATPSLPSGYSLPSLPSDSYAASELEPEPTPRAARRAPPPHRAAPSPANPFAQLGQKWDGIADLRATPLVSRTAKARTPGAAAKSTVFDEDDDDDDDLGYAMSPPVTMTFNLPPRAAAMYKAATPRKPGSAAVPAPVPDVDADKVVGDLMRDMAIADARAPGGFDDDDEGDDAFGEYEPSPRMPTPPGLGRYSIMPGELAPPGSDPAARRLFADTTAGPGPSASAPPLGPPPSDRPRRSLANTSLGSDILTSAGGPGRFISDDDTFEADDTFSTHAGESPMPSNPLARAGYADESYASDADADAGYYQAPAAQAQGTYTFDDDSFDEHGHAGQGEASLIFGSAANAARTGEGLVLMRPDEMVTFHGGRLEDARVPGSPTGLGRGAAGR